MGAAGILTQLCLPPKPADFAALLTIPLSVPFSNPTGALQSGLEVTEHFHSFTHRSVVPALLY